VTAAAILMVALIIGTAATWHQVRRTKEALRKKDAFIIENYPFFDQVGRELINSASNRFYGERAAGTETEAPKMFEQAIKVFQQAIELPPTDFESRVVIARAYTRLGYARWMLSLLKGEGDRPEPGLLADAQADYRRSIELVEKLRAESPNDPRIRRYLAQALGFKGMGCCMLSAFRPHEAEPLYRRSIEIRRELLRGDSPWSDAGVPAQADSADELEDLSYLVTTVHIVADILDGKGQQAEADRLRSRLLDDVKAIAERLSGKEFLSRRRTMAQRLLMSPESHGSSRRDANITYRLALNLDPESAQANNNLAWTLVSVPADPWFDPAEGLALAKKAVALEPNAWSFLNTLGVAEFRARHWDRATEVLQKSITFTGGGAHDLFFLAMTYWHQGSKRQAREFYARAVEWTEKNNPSDPELRRFRAEAEALLGTSCEKAKTTEASL
jgi:tetratricopeptide (TPR) repeat protein